MPTHRSDDDLRSLIEPIARQLLGEPNKQLSTATELRWGSNGSLAVDLGKGTFFNHEQKVGGGTLGLVEHVQLVDHDAAWAWVDTHYPAEPKPNGHDPGGHIVKAYDYVDADRTLLSQVCRKVPKAFVQRKPDGKGGWVWSTKGVKQVPYRLPDLLNAIEQGLEVWVVEGEKDADALWDAGVPATTNIGGAGKWRPELNPYFKGANLVVVGDHDPQARDKKTQALQFYADGRPVFPGQDHAVDVARQLAPVAKRLRLLRDLGDAWPECPAKGDVSDFLAKRPVAELEALAAALPDYGEVKAPAVLTGAFTAASLEGLPVPARLWHVPDLVPARTVTLLGGDGGVGKSILALQLAFATAVGLPWIGQTVRQGRALHLSAEDDRDELHRRNDQISLFYGVALERAPGLTMWSLADEDALLVTGPPGQPLELTGRWLELKRYVELDRPALLVLDSLADVYGASENERSQVRQFVRLLRGLAMPADTAVLLLGHPSLTGLSTGSGLSGSTAWNNSVRSRMFMAAPEAEEGATPRPDMRVLSVKKANYAQAGAEMRLRWVIGAFDTEDGQRMVTAIDRQVSADKVDALFLELLAAFGADGRVVSHLRGRNYAPSLFAADPRARGQTMKSFAAAMNRLFADSRIRVDSKGPPSRAISFISPASEAH